MAEERVPTQAELEKAEATSHVGQNYYDTQEYETTGVAADTVSEETAETNVVNSDANEMSPQEAYFMYVQSKGEFTLEQYFTALDKGNVSDFSQQASNIKEIYDGLETTLNDPNASSADKELAQVRLDKLSSIYKTKAEQWEKYKITSSPTIEQPTPTKDETQTADNTIAAKMDRVAEELQAAMPGVKIERGTIEVQESGAFKLNPQNTAEAPEAAAPATPTVEQPAPQNDAVQTNPDIELMAKKIRYMNVSNRAKEGSAKYVNPEETAQKLYALYGDKASELLHEAIMAPNDANTKASKTGAPISNNTQTLSREAVQYLADLTPAQAQKYANTDLTPAELAGNEQEQSAEPPAPEKNKQEALKDNLTDMKEKNPSAYADLQSAIEKLANGEDIGQVFANLIVKMMTEGGYEESGDGTGTQAFVQDAQAAIKDIEAKQQDGQTRAGIELPGVTSGLTKADISDIKDIKLDEYGYVVGSEAAKKHDADLKEYRNLYKTDNKKFKQAKESYEKAAETGEMPEQAKYYLGVIATVEKEEKLREQMLKDQEKAAKHIEKLNKKIEKLEKKLDKQKKKGNDEKADALEKELNKLKKEKEEIQKKQGKEEKGKEGKEDKAADGKGKGKNGKAATTKGKDDQQNDGQTPQAEGVVHKTQTGYKIVKGNEERSVDISVSNGKMELSYYNNGKPMTAAERMEFMKELAEKTPAQEAKQLNDVQMAILSGRNVVYKTDKEAQAATRENSTPRTTEAVMTTAQQLGNSGR